VLDQGGAHPGGAERRVVREASSHRDMVAELSKGEDVGAQELEVARRVGEHVLERDVLAGVAGAADVAGAAGVAIGGAGDVAGEREAPLVDEAQHGECDEELAELCQVEGRGGMDGRRSGPLGVADRHVGERCTGGLPNRGVTARV
jgi:hypothetical protein